jgi:hypothetical protein
LITTVAGPCTFRCSTPASLHWLEQGRAEGLEQGITRGQLAMLTKQLTLKFGEVAPEFQTRLASASRDELELWTERILRAETIEDVFT